MRQYPDPIKITEPYMNDPTNRWINGLTNEEHHKLPAISSTNIKDFHQKGSWSFYKKYVEIGSESYVSKNEYKIETLIHLAILEPEIFHKTVFVCDDAINTIKYKEFRNNLLINIFGFQNYTAENCPVVPSKNGGYMVGNTEIFTIKTHEMSKILRIQENVRNHPKVSTLLEKCMHREQSGIAQCPNTGLFLSCRGDARSDLGFFVELKSMNELSIHSVESSQVNYSYFLQHIHTIYVANLIEPDKYEEFYFVYIAKEFPNEVCLFHLDETSMEKSNDCYFNILDEIGSCEINKKWPTLDKGEGLLLNVPGWAFKKR